MPPRGPSRRSQELQAEAIAGQGRCRWRCALCGTVGFVDYVHRDDPELGRVVDKAATAALAGKVVWLHQDTKCEAYAKRFGGTTLAATQAREESHSANDADAA